MTHVYKILGADAWAAARTDGVFAGSPVDLMDGFIHLSDAAQAPQTARLHFRGQPDLIILQIRADSLGEALRWEPSRGGQLFPHLFAPLRPDQVTRSWAAPLDDEGVPVLGVLAP